MIRLKKIEIHVNEEFENDKELQKFKDVITKTLAKHLVNPPTVYNSTEIRENLLIKVIPTNNKPGTNNN
jgi:hypothetical protein